MSRVLKQRKVWVSVVTCCKCKKKKTFWHHGVTNKTEAKDDWASESINGWFVGVKGKEECEICRNLP